MALADVVPGEQVDLLEFYIDNRSIPDIFGYLLLTHRLSIRIRSRQLLVLAFSLGAILSCDNEDTPPPDYSALGGFQTTEARIITARDTVVLRVQLAQNDDQRSLGLMERTALPDGTGMLFLYDSVQDSTASFWMFRTRIPLDIAFIDSTGTIASITRMVPCESINPDFCPTYPAHVRFSSALEVPAGYFERAGIDVGDRVSAYARSGGDSARGRSF